ncbi:MAG: hypothetical protein ACK5PP_01640 [Acidimicrobiales bacterium]
MTGPAATIATIAARHRELLVEAARFDDDALAHLANRGLVRRAAKLAGPDVGAVGTDDGIEVSGDGWAVAFPAGASLTAGRCGCATAGVCQHLVAAIMQLRDHVARSVPPAAVAPAVPPAGTAPDPVPDGPTAGGGEPGAIRRWLLALTDDELLTWARTTDRRWALTRAASIEPEDVVVEGDDAVSIELPVPHPAVRFLRADLDGALVKPSGRHDRRAVALAVLCLWRSVGRTVEPLGEAVARPTELTEERAAVSARAVALCRHALITGLLHLSDSERERFDSLSASARGVKLHRAAVVAERVADQIDALGAQSPEADSARLLDHLAELATVSETLGRLLAAGRPLPDALVGRARAAYAPIGSLDVAAVGHYRWGDHRFAGVTAVFLEGSGRSYTLTRPRIAHGRPIPDEPGWQGAGSVEALTGRQLRVSGAEVGDDHRLSGRASTSVSVGDELGPADLADLAWDGTRPVIRGRLLARTPPAWVAVRVDAVAGPPVFDRITQTTEWTVTSAGQAVRVRLRYRPATAAVVAGFESAVLGAAPRFVIGRMQGTGDGPELWPISVVDDHALVCLAGSGVDPGAPARPDPAAGVAPVAVSSLDRIAGRLVALAERGRRPSSAADLAAFGRQATDWGFPALGSIVAAADHGDDAVLRAAWFLGLLADTDA